MRAPGPAPRRPSGPQSPPASCVGTNHASEPDPASLLPPQCGFLDDCGWALGCRQSIVSCWRQFSHAKPEEHAFDFMVRRSAQSRATIFTEESWSAIRTRKGNAMAYDLLIKNGRIVDGSGMPAFRGDVGVKDGKIAEIGKLSGPATRTIDAAGRVVAPGFIDNHCHYDAQVTWDPLCSFSCDHGATSVIFGNCSLSLAPVRKGNEERLCPNFCPMSKRSRWRCCDTLEFDWETVPRISRPARSQSRRQCRQSDRPYRGALLRDGRRLPKAHGHRRRDQANAGSRARRHEGRGPWRLCVAQPGPFRPAGCSYPRDLGGREGDLRDRRRACASSAPA